MLVNLAAVYPHCPPSQRLMSAAGSGSRAAAATALSACRLRRLISDETSDLDPIYSVLCRVPQVRAYLITRKT